MNVTSLAEIESRLLKALWTMNNHSVQNPTRDRPNLPRWLLVMMVMWAAAPGMWKTIINMSSVFDTERNEIDWTLFRVGLWTEGPGSRVVDGYMGDGTVGMYLRCADIAV